MVIKCMVIYVELGLDYIKLESTKHTSQTPTTTGPHFSCKVGVKTNSAHLPGRATVMISKTMDVSTVLGIWSVSIRQRFLL